MGLDIVEYSAVILSVTKFPQAYCNTSYARVTHIYRVRVDRFQSSYHHDIIPAIKVWKTARGRPRPREIIRIHYAFPESPCLEQIFLFNSKFGSTQDSRG